MNNRARANEAMRRQVRRITGTKDRASRTQPRVVGDRRPPTFADDYDRRMSNWRRWKIHGDAYGSGSSPSDLTRFASGLYTRTDPRRREAMMPLINGEAQETDRAVRSIAPHLRQAVETVYLQPGGMDAKARLCGCRRETLKERLDQAKSAIFAELTRRSRAYRAMEEQQKREQQAATARSAARLARAQ